jgi:hypothetical protein
MSSSAREGEPPTSLNNPSVPAAFTVPAVDGYPIRGLRWREVQGLYFASNSFFIVPIGRKRRLLTFGSSIKSYFR